MASKFKEYQKEICETIPQPPPLKEICGDCVPNPDYIEPNWRMMVDQPYLNEKTCEYQICVISDQNAEGFRIHSGNPLPTGIELTRLLNKFKSPAIVLLLEYYGKLIADQIICASFDGPTLSGMAAEELLQSYDNYSTVYEALAKDPLAVIDPLDVSGQVYGGGVFQEAYGPSSNSDTTVPKFKACQDLTKLIEADDYQFNGFDPETGIVQMDATVVEIMSKYPQIKNPYALELYAYVKDFDAMDGLLKVLISIPTFILDAVPDEPTSQDLQESAEEMVKSSLSDTVEIDVKEFFGQIRRLSTSLMVYSKYQSHFYRTQDGWVGWKKEKGGYCTLPEEERYQQKDIESAQDCIDAGGEWTPGQITWQDYYAQEYPKKLLNFWNQLYLVSKENGFSMSSAFKGFARPAAEKIRITFDKSDPEKPFKYTKNVSIEAKQLGCEYQKYTKGLGKDFKKLFDDTTLINYIVRMKEIDTALQAKKSYPWLDFLMKFTYPTLTINYGKLNDQSVEDSVGQCVADNALSFSIDLKDYLLDQVLGLKDVLAFEFNTKNCRSLESDDEPELDWINKKTETDDGPMKPSKMQRDKKREAKANSWKNASTDGDVQAIANDIKMHERKIAAAKEAISACRWNFEEWKEKSKTTRTKDAEIIYQKGIKEDNERALKDLKKREWEKTNNKIMKNRYKRDEDYKAAVKGMRQAKRKARRENKHPFILEARKLAMEEIAQQDTILTSILSFSDFEKSGFSGIKFNPRGKISDKFKTDAGRFSLCEVKSLTMEAIRCLFAGVTEEVALGKIVEATLKAMDIDVFGFFVEALPPQIQLEVRAKLEKEFGDLPLPWEEGYDPGNIYNTNAYIANLKNRSGVVLRDKNDNLSICDETYYQLLQALPQPPSPDADNYEALKSAWDDPEFQKNLQNRKLTLERQHLTCVELAKGTEHVNDDGTKRSVRYDWSSEYPEPEEPIAIPEYDFTLPDPNLDDYSDKETIEAGWRQYIEETAKEGFYRETGAILETQAIEVRDQWYEYVRLYHYVPDANHINPDTSNPYTVGELQVLGAGSSLTTEEKRIRSWNPSNESWREWYDYTTTTLGVSIVTVDEASLILFEMNEKLREEFDNVEKAARDKYDAEVAKINAKNARIKAENDAEATLRERVGELSEEELANAYANLRSGDRIATGRDPDNNHPGTYGKALGNAQELIINTYIQYLMDMYNVTEILNILDRFPGSEIVGDLISAARCSYQGFFDPPVKSFLSTLSLQTCGGFRSGIKFPEPTKVKGQFKPSYEAMIVGFNNQNKLLYRMQGLFRKKFEDAIIGVMSQIIVKLFQTLDEGICKSINAIGKGIGNLFSPNSLDDAMRDAFCPEADDEDLRNTKNNLFKASGVDPNVSDDSFDCLYEVLNSTMSKKDYLELFTANPGQNDEATLRKIADLVNAFCPEFADYMGTPSDVGRLIDGTKAYISPELRDALRDRLRDPEDGPIYSSICLTQEDWDQWNEDRKNLLCDSGIDCDVAQRMVDNANNRAEEDLGNLANLMAKNPEGLLGDALGKMLKPQGDCVDQSSNIITYEDEEQAAITEDLMKGFFEFLEKDFYMDLISRPQSVLNNILRDTNNARLKGHEMRVNTPIFFPNYSNSEIDWDFRKENGPIWIKWMMEKSRQRGFFPDTVGIWMKDKLLEEKVFYKSKPANSAKILLDSFASPGGERLPTTTSDDEEQHAEIVLHFEDNGNGDGDVEYEFDLKYFVNHTNPPRITIGTFQTYHDSLSRKEAKKLGLENKFKGKTVVIDSVNVFPDTSIISKYDNFKYAEYAEQYSMQTMVFKSFLESKILDKIKTTRAISSAFQEINSNVVNFVVKSVLNTPTGEDPTGFKFGYNVQEAITFMDLLYVNPDADPANEDTWEYTHDNDEGVLGKSATENPRVHFLDPAIHGGTYKRPKIYIEPATYNGWLGMIRTFVSEVSQCENKDTGFLDVAGISKRAKKLENDIPMDERLSLPNYCRTEYPYDKISSSATHGIMEGVVISTIRIYVTEFVLKTFPVFGSVEMSDLNIDNTFLDAMMSELEQGLSIQDSWFNIVERYTYYLLFLEQGVQVVQRQINDELIEETEELTNAFKVIDAVQQNFVPNPFLRGNLAEAVKSIQEYQMQVTDSITGEVSIESLTSTPNPINSMLLGAAVLAYGKDWKQEIGETFSGAEMQETFFKMGILSPFKINLISKIASIYESQAAAKTILRALVDKEMKSVIEKLIINQRPRPHIQNISKYLLSRNGIMFDSSLRSGEMDMEQPVFEVDTSNPAIYGDIPSVVRNVETENPLSSMVLTVGAHNFTVPTDYKNLGTFLLDGLGAAATESIQGVDIGFNPQLLEQAASDVIQSIKDFIGDKIKDSISIGRSGIFYLEKYLRVTDKNGKSQVYNIQEFQEILRNRTDLDPEKYVSDYYGDAYVMANQLQGSIGIKFGVRLVYSPPADFDYAIPPGKDFERTYQFPPTPLKVEFKDSFYKALDKIDEKVGDIPIIGQHIPSARELAEDLEIDFPSTARAIPMVIYEENIVDKKISELDLDGPNFGENLKCYIDKLVLEEDFKVLFDFCFPAKTYVSLMGIYSLNGFFPSIGQSETEIGEDSKGWAVNSMWRAKVFDRSKKSLRKMFNSTYRTDDDEKQERKGRSRKDYGDFLKNILPGAYLNIDSSVNWFQRYRIVDINPFDADGKDCKNEFQKLFDRKKK